MALKRPTPSPDAPDALQVTERQLELLRALHRWARERGRMPSVRELAEGLGRSPSTIQQHLGALERRGLVQRNGDAHGLRLLVGDRQIGAVTAGAMLPLKGVFCPNKPLRRSRSPFPRIGIGGETQRGDYALRVEGDRLSADGILDGDLLVIRPGTADEHPALVEFPDGTFDLRRVTTLRDGTVGLLAPRPQKDSRRAPRRTPDVLVRGRLLRVVRIFD